MKTYNDIDKTCNNISGVALSQWKQLCNVGKDNDYIVRLKIRRAIHLGKVTQIYDIQKTHIIIRFYDVNILLISGVVYTIWKDKTRPMVKVNKAERDAFDDKYGLL